jgi:hypothetical protein
MVLLYSQQGQLANRLWQAAYFISNAIENKYTFLHLGFAKYVEFFDENCCTQLKEIGGNCRIIDFKTTSFWDRIVIKYANLSKDFHRRENHHFPIVKEIEVNIENYDISEISFQLFTKKKIIIANGWIFVDAHSIMKHSEIIRRIFKPNKIFLDHINILRGQTFSKYDYVIGVHIRKADYATYFKGKWFYSDDDYISFIKQTNLLPTFKNKNVGFLLCSDEKISIKEVKGINLIYSTNHFIEDLYSLSICDYIIGPPSTYSSWASFYGKVPLLRLESKNMEIREKDFKIVES